MVPDRYYHLMVFYHAFHVTQMTSDAGVLVLHNEKLLQSISVRPPAYYLHLPARDNPE
jgi:hypothetical protein